MSVVIDGDLVDLSKQPALKVERIMVEGELQQLFARLMSKHEVTREEFLVRYNLYRMLVIRDMSFSIWTHIVHTLGISTREISLATAYKIASGAQEHDDSELITEIYRDVVGAWRVLRAYDTDYRRRLAEEALTAAGRCYNCGTSCHHSAT